MPRAAFLAVFQQRAISYTQGIMIALASPHLLLILMLCLARLIVYRPVSSVCNDIAIGADGVGFVAWALGSLGQSGQSVASAASYADFSVAQAQNCGDNNSNG